MNFSSHSYLQVVVLSSTQTTEQGLLNGKCYEIKTTTRRTVKAKNNINLPTPVTFGDGSWYKEHQ